MKMLLTVVWVLVAGLLFVIWDIARQDVLIALFPSMYAPGADATGMANAIALGVTIIKGVVAIGPIVWIWKSKQIERFSEQYKAATPLIAIGLIVALGYVFSRGNSNQDYSDYAECVFDKVPSTTTADEAKAGGIYCAQVYGKDMPQSDAMTWSQCYEKRGAGVKTPVGLLFIKQACMKKYGNNVTLEDLDRYMKRQGIYPT